MKVALVHFCFYEYTVELANSLAQYVDLTIIHPENLADLCKDVLKPSIRIRSFKKPRMRDPRNIAAMWEMMGIIRDLQPDVLHVQETNEIWYDLMLLLNKMPPLVTTIHDVFGHPGDRNIMPGAQYTRPIAFYRSQQLIVHAQLLKDTLIKQFRVQAQRVNVLPHGELGSLYQRAARDKGLTPEPYTLLFYGRIWPYKGLKYLLEAMPLIAESIPEVKLIVAGRGENLKQYFPNGYDDERYHILNHFIPPEEVAGLFQRSTAIILPYTEASQSGIATIAYGMGTPVIASNVGGLAEMIRHEKDGLLVPPGDVKALADTIIRLLSDRSLQHRLRMAALARCSEDLNWSNIAAQTVEVYQKAIDMKSTSLLK